MQEAHPSDGWQVKSNEEQNVIFEQPKTYDRRVEIAEQCCTRLKLSMPCVVDTIENQVDALYAGWPERFFIVDPDGRIAFAGEPGPWGFQPAEVERWLRKHTGR